MSDMKDMELKNKVVKACKILYMEGVRDTFEGHLSGRHPGSNKIFIPGHIHMLGRALGSTTIDDIITVNLEDNTWEGKYEPVEELIIHTAIYRARSDVNSVFHAHPPMATAYGVAGQQILPILIGNWGSMFWGEGTPILDTDEVPEMIVTAEEGRKLVKKLGKSWAVLHRGHGVVVAGESVEDCCIKAIGLEKSAKMQLICKLIGGPRPFTKEKAAELVKHMGPHITGNLWNYFTRKLNKCEELI